MNPWPFVIGAYAFAFIGTAGLFAASFAAMRKAEREAEQLSKRP
jgi:hypothetical protein